ncbi:protein-disulfide reductase DsbD [Methylomonas paludis]|uniref:Thiol:disulfide interchange protein DsbD n=1 Tax=Methylomonas paludis TaxID=1173101 RepID=A0A975R8A1_9GAMM|nr:protein-disulfide reductase DsbD [Methylomonas paludis]QWF70160.1 protein-disulfide reductase DsbD [Methylomonas paludis]
MLVYRLIVLIFFGMVSQTLPALDSKDILPVDQAFQLSVRAISPEKLEISWQIAEGYHLYQDKIKFQSQIQSIQLGEYSLPTGVVEQDAVFGEVVVYRGLTKVELPLLYSTAEDKLSLLVKYQGCADIGVCYPPQKVILDVVLPAKPASNSDSGLSHLVQNFKNLAPGAFNSDLLPAEQAFKFNAEVKDDHTLHVTWIPAPGYYLYKDKLLLSLEGVASQVHLAKLQLPPGEAYHDAEFGQVEIYRQEVAADVSVVRDQPDAETIVLLAKYQGCAERGVCYPPMQTRVSLSLPAVILPAALNKTSSVAANSEQDNIVNSLKRDGLALTLLSFFGFGVLLAFTPCVFPMIPILSGIIVGQGSDITTRKAFLLSLSYVLASALMYTLFGILAALFGSNLQAAFQNPWVITAFSSVFVVLSLSMFGFYNLELPQSLQNRVLNSSDKHRDGSYWGAGIMGALSALIVGPCVAAPLAAALIYIGQTGDVVLGGFALFAMGLGMGLPLLALGASAGKLLPKSGAWLNSTKTVFGVIMLGVAVWMLSRILPINLVIFFTALLLIIPGIYLSAIDPLPNSASGWRKLWKGLGFVMLVWGVLELIGLSAGSKNLLQPLQGLAANTPQQAKIGLVFQKVHTLAELDSKVKQATANHKPVMLDFYAEWCVSCKEMEEYTFTDAEVQHLLADYVLLQADVTENNQEDMVLLKHFGLIGPPGIIFFTSAGTENSASRIIGYQDAKTFSDSLQVLNH